MSKPELAGTRSPIELRKHPLRNAASMLLSLMLATSMLPVAAFADDIVEDSSVNAGSSLALESAQTATPIVIGVSSEPYSENADSSAADDPSQGAGSDEVASLERGGESVEGASDEPDDLESASDPGNGATSEPELTASDNADASDAKASDGASSAVGLPATITSDSGTVVAPVLFASNSSFPDAFDLRNVDGMNYVTSVKQQSPWGDCWSFAAVAAAETSILYELGISNEAGDSIDLSELHLAWFAASPIKDNLDGQLGEGATWLGDNQSERLNAG